MEERLAANRLTFICLIGNQLINSYIMSLVLEASNLKKIKVILDDYPYAQDIQQRVLLHGASTCDIKVLEEILFSSIKTSYSKLLESTDLEPAELNKSLHLFKQCGLIKEDGEHLVIDKDLRKFFELEIQRFEEDFNPGIEFLAQIFKKVPIHILPVWYALPRTSTNIFESIIEKYLHTPQIYQRLLTDAQTHEPQLKNIIDLLFTADQLELDLEFLQQKFNLGLDSLFQLIAQLEFNLIACVKYQQKDQNYRCILTPFSEFKNYLLHLRNTEALSLDESKVNKITLAPFDFVEGLFTLIKCFKNKTFTYPLNRHQEAELKEALSENNLSYLELEELMQKLFQVQLIDQKNGQVNINETSQSFISMKPESASLILYRHPLNKPKFNLSISVEKAIRECEKASSRLIGKGWVLVEDFMKGLVIPFSEEQQVLIKKVGRRWQYHLPVYSSLDLEFINYIFTDWFEKVGVMEQGFYNDKPCIRLTTLGTEIFS
jgi:hypothetical protein